MEWLLPSGVAVASLALTYFMCLRPMRRGYCRVTPAASGDDSKADRAEIASLRAEIAELRPATVVSKGSSGPQPHQP